VTVRFALKILLSLAVGAVCVVYAVHGMDRHAVGQALRALPLSAIGTYLATLAVTHLFRAWRWEFLLRPLRVSLPLRRLLLISSVGFMAILALPVRLGEFVRPYFLTRERGLRMSAALGTVAVERIVDGLLISILFFVSYLLSAGDVFSRELRVGAWLSLVGFVALTTFLVLARIWTEQTIAIALRVSLLHYLAPVRAHQISDKLRALISGFHSMADRRNFGIFLFQSVLYWGVNGFGMWILARQMGLPISLGAAYTTMAFTGVILSLPNAPGLVGQFHAAIKLGLLSYLPASVVNAQGMAFAIVLHGLQTIWYIGVGLLSLTLLSASGPRTSWTQAVRESNRAAEDVSTGGA
jgi:glycosyltransferase 2 family protein